MQVLRSMAVYLKAMGWATVLVLIAGLFFAAGGSRIVGADEAAVQPSRVVFPPEGVLIPPGKLVLIGRTTDGDFRLGDGRFPWQYRRGTIVAAEVELSPGKYVVEVGNCRRELIAVAGPGANKAGQNTGDGNSPPPELAIVNWHPMKPSAESCEACHRPEGPGENWPAVATPQACFPCHNPIQLEAIHAHPMEHLHHCQDCHHMHAAPREHLLTKPPKELCRACHEA